MGWADLPATQTTDAADWDFRKQFANAVIERGIACGYYSASKPPYTTFVDDTDAHGIDTSELAPGDIQLEIELMRQEKGFVDPSGLVGSPEDPGYYPADAFWTAAGAPAAARPSDCMQAATSPGASGLLIRVGEKYAVLKTAAGAWAGHDGEIATCTGTGPETWSFNTPADGYLIEQSSYSSGTHKWKGIQYRRRDASATDWPIATDVGWTRKYPRQIERIGDGGANGQRARLAGVSSNSNDGGTRYMTVQTAPPTIPYTNAKYGVQAGATGAWAGQAGKLATWNGAAWSFAAVGDGTQYCFNATGTTARRNAYAAIKESAGGARWHIIGDLYDHNGAAWSLSGDQASDPDLVTDYGPAADGDYLGPWIFNELRAALDLLTVVVCTNGSDWGGTRTVHVGDSGWEAAWADAKTGAENDWDGNGTVTTNGLGYSDTGPSAYSAGEKGGLGFAGHLYRRHYKQKGEFAEGDTSLKCDVDFYAVGQPFYTGTGNEWGDQGDDIQNGAATLWLTKSAQTNGDEFISDLWDDGGQGTKPSQWCGQPAEGSTSNKGYKIAGWQGGFVTKDFAVTGGFEFQ